MLFEVLVSKILDRLLLKARCCNAQLRDAFIVCFFSHADKTSLKAPDGDQGSARKQRTSTAEITYSQRYAGSSLEHAVRHGAGSLVRVMFLFLLACFLGGSACSPGLRGLMFSSRSEFNHIPFRLVTSAAAGWPPPPLLHCFLHVLSENRELVDAASSGVKWQLVCLLCSLGLFHNIEIIMLIPLILFYPCSSSMYALMFPRQPSSLLLPALRGMLASGRAGVEIWCHLATVRVA